MKKKTIAEIPLSRKSGEMMHKVANLWNEDFKKSMKESTQWLKEEREARLAYKKQPLLTKDKTAFFVGLGVLVAVIIFIGFLILK